LVSDSTGFLRRQADRKIRTEVATKEQRLPFEAMTELITLDTQELQKLADDVAMHLPGADLEHRLDPNWDLYKVRGKVFLLMTDLPGRPVVILKADPDNAVALREQYADITPGYHMNKKHWITVEGGGTVDEKLVKQLVTDSYQLVVGAHPHRGT
jgi:predicted DNA-binding protein (MmcQ/YjbR family)